MADYPIPPWISGLPNPVDAYSHGLQIGASIGQDQARQQLAQEQALQKAQQQIVDEQIKQAKFQLESDEQARRFAAQQGFQQAVDSGVDPATAALKFGPQMGITGPALAQFSKSMQQFPLNVQQQGGESFLQTGPQSWQHVPQPQSLQPRLFHNSDGTVTRVNPDGTVETLGTARTGTTKLDKVDSAKVTAYTKELADIDKALSPSNLDRMKDPDRTEKLMQERLRVMGELSKLQKKIQAPATQQPAKGSFIFDRSTGKIVSRGTIQETEQADDEED